MEQKESKNSEDLTRYRLLLKAQAFLDDDLEKVSTLWVCSFGSIPDVTAATCDYWALLKRPGGKHRTRYSGQKYFPHRYDCGHYLTLFAKQPVQIESQGDRHMILTNTTSETTLKTALVNWSVVEPEVIQNVDLVLGYIGTSRKLLGPMMNVRFKKRHALNLADTNQSRWLKGEPSAAYGTQPIFRCYVDPTQIYYADARPVATAHQHQWEEFRIVQKAFHRPVSLWIHHEAFTDQMKPDMTQEDHQDGFNHRLLDLIVHPDYPLNQKPTQVIETLRLIRRRNQDSPNEPRESTVRTRCSESTWDHLCRWQLMEVDHHVVRVTFRGLLLLHTAMHTKAVVRM